MFLLQNNDAAAEMTKKGGGNVDRRNKNILKILCPSNPITSIALLLAAFTLFYTSESEAIPLVASIHSMESIRKIPSSEFRALIDELTSGESGEGRGLEQLRRAHLIRRWPGNGGSARNYYQPRFSFLDGAERLQYDENGNPRIVTVKRRNSRIGGNIMMG